MKEKIKFPAEYLIRIFKFGYVNSVQNFEMHKKHLDQLTNESPLNVDIREIRKYMDAVALFSAYQQIYTKIIDNLEVANTIKSETAIKAALIPPPRNRNTQNWSEEYHDLYCKILNREIHGWSNHIMELSEGGYPDNIIFLYLIGDAEITFE